MAQFRLCGNIGDTTPVPQLIFAKLETEGSDARFRVALYVVSQKETDSAKVAGNLHISLAEAESALNFWEGAGLLERPATQAETPKPKIEAAPRTHMDARQVQQLSQSDPMLGTLMQEVQRITGVVISNNETCVLTTLYQQDHFPADLIMMAAQQCAAENKTGVRSIERKLFAWRKEGIEDCESADQYLKLLALRAEREEQIAKLLESDAPSFTLAERRRIATWFEEYSFSEDMIENARMNAGENQNNVKYLHKILEKWHKKGYRSPRDVSQAEGPRNLRVQSQKNAKAKSDILQDSALSSFQLWREET